MKVWESRGSQTLLSILKTDPDVKAKLDDKTLEAIFTYEDYIKNAGPVMDRLFAS